MKIRYVGLALCLLIICSISARGDNETLRILTFNIYWGGQDHGDVLGRADEWLALMIDYNPDLIVIQEANGWLPEDDDLISQYVAALNVSRRLT